MKPMLCAGLLLTLATGCASGPDPTRRDLGSSERMAGEQNAPAKLKPYYQRLYMEGESNATLNRMRLASAAIEQGEWKDAELSLDDVIRNVEALGPADERSREALSKFESEDIKRFKGEAYERSMAYFLRGLLYLRADSFDNARACFKSVQVFDAAKTDPKLHGNWASADWLEGWCNWNLNEKNAAQECWERAKRHSSTPLSIPSPDDNTLCVALLGFGPIKIPTGDQGERLDYRAGNSKTLHVRVKVNGVSKSPVKMEDLLAQASGRGLRQMDVVNEGKADTKASADTAGDVLILGGAGATVGGSVAGDTTVAAAGLGAAAAGMITKGIASGIHPKADTRTWDLLPASIQILPLNLPQGDQSLDVQFLNDKGNVVSEKKIVSPNSSRPRLLLLIER